MTRALMLKEAPLWLATIALAVWAITMLIRHLLDSLGSDKEALNKLLGRMDTLSERMERIVESSEKQKELLLRLYERINR